MPTSPPIDPQAVLAQLTLDEKIQLSAGSDVWRTAAIKRLNVPYIKLTDGPNGARGGGDFNDSTPSTLFPSPSCLGATWDVQLAHEMGRWIGLDAIEKQCHVVLGPTINIQRDPRAGRFFESYSEDAVLTGLLGAAWVRGTQSTGVGATMKHFVANECETDRRFSSSNVDPTALREVYLEPFRLIMAECARARTAFGGQPACVMTSYNRINGVSGSDNDVTINQILRKEWGFRGLVMSDWFALHDLDLATTDLEMPGPPIFRQLEATKAAAEGKPDVLQAIDECAARVLQVVRDVAPLGYHAGPDDEHESSVDVDQVGRAIRQIAAEGAVLLKNEGDVLPLTPAKGMRIACIGAPWVDAVQSGGGSAALTPQKVMQPLATFKTALQQANHVDVDVQHHIGCPMHNFVKVLEEPMICAYYTGREPGKGSLLGELVVEQATLKGEEPRRPKDTPANDHWVHCTLNVPAPSKDTTYRFGFVCLGSLQARVHLADGDSTTQFDFKGEQDLFEYMLNPRRCWDALVVSVRAGQTVRMEIDYVPVLLNEQYKHTLMSGIQIGMEEEVDEEAMIAEAARAASDADVVLLLTALGKDWESEGYDRQTLRLPRKQDALISAVANASAPHGKTIVLNITGGPIEVQPWLSAVAGLVQCWYGGQEAAEALCDVLLGRGSAPASGHLAHVWPAKIQDHPSGTEASHFPGVPGEGGPHVCYVEGRLVGYKHYGKRAADAPQPLYHFGYGLGGYTTFKTEGPFATSNTVTRDSLPLQLSVTTTNTGARSGKETAQLYVRLPSETTTADEPVQKLAGFTTLRAEPGASTSGEIALHQDAFSVWDEQSSAWRVRAGRYEVVLAGSARLDDVLGRITVDILDGWTWSGLGVV